MVINQETLRTETTELLESLKFKAINVAEYIGTNKQNFNSFLKGTRKLTADQASRLAKLNNRFKKLPSDLWKKGAYNGEESKEGR